MQFLLLGLCLTAVYGSFLDAPIFFDDLNYFGGRDFSQPQFSFADALNMRWLPYASLEWTVLLFGDTLVPLRLGNLLLHLMNAGAVLLLLRRLYGVAAAHDAAGARPPIDVPWLAFFGALIFVLHPMATFGVAYLVQRSILLATFFALVTWWLFLTGLVNNRRGWLLASCVTYLLSGFSKEHALLVPAVSLALVPLVRRFDAKTIALLWPSLLGYLLAALFLVYRVKAGQIIGQAYEPYGNDLLDELGIARETAYPLSVLTQSFLFFKYWLLWLLPNPQAMSITMESGFARDFTSWPQVLGPLMFLGYLALAIRLLRRRGALGLLGFALLVPALLFVVEFSVVRVQEIFVLYRSYLWMPCLAAALPFVLGRLHRRHALVLLLTGCSLLAAASFSRLQTTADPVLLWREALDHTLASETRNHLTINRAYHNLAQAYINGDRYAEAVATLNAAIQLSPGESDLYNDRAVAYGAMKRYEDALADYGRAIALKPYAPLYYFGRAEIYDALLRRDEAMNDYSYSCRLGKQEACTALAASRSRG